ncbi:hypothetical protein BDY17DRAFT_313187 [Neohortaea acidophila]|uniref:Uncharacterized protein n=1 Tax=Neohortaea acidophila TaxID=245834 RepID=A0A6A6PH40_9PEZI|nr:uncharacterized protein BDY17DRAFT_313187 [Neohortaea acidophila]KAF2479328.1 hypothetical protein BDY17DRAFT_313187 [Neohortaea acidophila]
MSSLPGDAENIRNTFSSWDSCMSEAYCKWPVIAGIVIGSLIVLSVIYCCARCLCCGAECCCAMCSCFNACCPSPRKNKSDGYQKPQAYPPYAQYQNQPPAMYYGGGGYRPAQTATFDAPSGKYNEDALPAMPSWSTAQSRRIEQEAAEPEDVELDKLDQHSPPEQSLLHQGHDSAGYHQEDGDLGAMAANPYNDHSPYQPQHDPSQYQAPYNRSQYQPQPHQASQIYTPPTPLTPEYEEPNPYQSYNQYQPRAQYHQSSTPLSSVAPSSIYASTVAPTYRTQPPSMYGAPQPHQPQQYAGPYGNSPPSYRTAPSVVGANSPPQSHARMPSAGSYGVPRKPISGTWREL